MDVRVVVGRGRWLASAVLLLSGCGVVPVPGVLEPVFGSSKSYTTTQMCIVDHDAARGLRVAEVQKEEGSGRLFIERDGRRRRIAVSKEGGYAADADWLNDDTPIRQYGRRFVKYGPRRVVPATALTRGADHEGVPLYVDRKDAKQPDALYVPVEPGCVFQAYVDEAHVSGRRAGPGA